ncbi:hypothetical protein GCM10025778_32920 [Paeniglutamicibacter antarcticus]|uniref:Uncharacterized protein n=1 Tax=Paeniglutamicibacter antarcticus TaxID=494023 RepID=A0ABP9TR24_9MICC
MAGPCVHPRRLDDFVSLGGYGAGEDGPVGGCAFDHPESGEVRAGATCHPGNGAVDASAAGGEILGIVPFAGRGGDNGVNVVPCVGVDTDDKRMCMGAMVIAVIRTFLFTDVVMAAVGRYQSG